MRVTEIEMMANDVSVMEISLKNAGRNDRYLAKAVVGLDPDVILPKFYGFGLTNGEKFYNYGLKTREIVMRIVTNPDYTINEKPADLRDRLYRTISSSRTGGVRLILKSGATSVAEIFGQITKFEVPHFSKVPELQITVKCTDPIFRSVTDIEVDVARLGSTHPFEVVDAISTSPHGLEMSIRLNSPKANFILQDKETNPSWKFEIAPQGGFFANDVIHICNEREDKTVEVNRTSVVTPLANAVVLGSMWPVLFPGLNTFYSNYSGSMTWLEFTYRPTFWGV